MATTTASRQQTAETGGSALAGLMMGGAAAANPSEPAATQTGHSSIMVVSQRDGEHPQTHLSRAASLKSVQGQQVIVAVPSTSGPQHHPPVTISTTDKQQTRGQMKAILRNRLPLPSESTSIATSQDTTGNSSEQQQQTGESSHKQQQVGLFATTATQQQAQSQLVSTGALGPMAPARALRSVNYAHNLTGGSGGGSSSVNQNSRRNNSDGKWLTALA